MKAILLIGALLSSNLMSMNATEIYKGKDVAWGFDFLTSNKLLITHRSGKLVEYNIKNKTRKELLAPKVYADGQGGLLDIQIYQGYIYITYSEKLKSKKIVTSLARKKINEKKFKKIFESNAHGDKDIHFGSRLAFKQDKIFMTVGERSERDLAQSLKHHNGKVLRLNLDGTVPKDNPYVKTQYLPEIWSYGHRNPQGIGFHPKTGELYEVEFGPRGGDEINIIQPKKNYGWPVITYGKEYWGPSIGDKKRKGMEQPLKYWVPSISPSGMSFYTGDKILEWKNNLFLACLSEEHLRRIVIKDKKVIKEEALFTKLEERVRSVRTGVDGYLYFSTDSGKIFKVSK